MSTCGDKSALQSRIALPGKAKKSLLHREGLSSFQLSVFYVQLLPSPSLPLRKATSSSFLMTADL
jgi:hypothetical protein